MKTVLCSWVVAKIFLESCCFFPEVFQIAVFRGLLQVDFFLFLLQDLVVSFICLSIIILCFFFHFFVGES